MKRSRDRVPNLIEALTALQQEQGFLRDEDLRALAERVRVPLYELEGLCSYYPHFRRTPPKPIRVHACRDLACHLRGGRAASDRLRSLCDARTDVEFASVSCLGRCDSAPACAINDKPMTTADALRRLEDPHPASPSLPPQVKRRWQIDPHASASEHHGELRSWLSRPAGEARSRALIDRLTESGLCGMGGAGFPTGRKWDLVSRVDADERYVVCNADESEPGTFKDRVILDELSHLVLEGMALAGLAIGSHEGIVYIRHEYGRERESLRRAIASARSLGALGDDVFGSGFRFDVRIFVSPGGYILGEETALLEALEGKRGEPRNKPPFPGVRGLYGKPTLINNVETFAQVPNAVRSGEAPLKFFSVSGDVASPQVLELPLGTTLRTLIERCGGLSDGRELLAFLPGGASTGFLPAEQIDVAMDWDSLRARGSALGSGAVLIVAEGTDLLDLARNLTEFFRNESCGKCVPCRLGTKRAVDLIAERSADSLAAIEPLAQTLRDTSICGLGQAALNPIESVLEHFPDLVEASERDRP